VCSGAGGGANVKGGIPSILRFLKSSVRGIRGECPTGAAEFGCDHCVAPECAPRTGKCFGDPECSWRVRDKRQREPGAGLLINAAREPLVPTLENPAEKTAIVNVRFTHAGKS